MHAHAIPATSREDAIRRADYELSEAQDWIAYARTKLANEDITHAVYATHTTNRFAGEALEWLTELLVWTEDDDDEDAKA